MSTGPSNWRSRLEPETLGCHGGHVQQSGACARSHSVAGAQGERENGGPYVADGGVELFDRLSDAIQCRHVVDRAGSGLQGHAHGEEPLDDVIVQVPGDAFTVDHDGELFAVVLGTVELDGEAGLLPEALDHPDLLGAETGSTHQPHHAQHAVVAV